MKMKRYGKHIKYKTMFHFNFLSIHMTVKRKNPLHCIVAFITNVNAISMKTSRGGN